MQTTKPFDQVIIDEIKHIFQKHLKNVIFKLFLFGSRADGSYNERSDYDIGFILEKKVEADIMKLILDDIDSMKTLYKIDLVDLNKTSRQFYEVSMKDALLLT
jgi:predicted nucleotidyltransferase